MTDWVCANCGVVNEDDFDLCYACGAGRDGTPAAAGFLRDDAAPADDQLRRLDCLRCRTAMDYAGRQRFHEGGVAQAVLLGEFFVDRAVFDTYACPACGKVELFLPPRR